MSDTQFMETEALLAVMADDAPKAAQILDQMLPGELRELAEAATHLAILANKIVLMRTLPKPKP